MPFQVMCITVTVHCLLDKLHPFLSIVRQVQMFNTVLGVHFMTTYLVSMPKPSPTVFALVS